jgi:hypothetical protein
MAATAFVGGTIDAESFVIKYQRVNNLQAKSVKRPLTQL